MKYNCDLQFNYESIKTCSQRFYHTSNDRIVFKRLMNFTFYLQTYYLRTDDLGMSDL